MRDSIKHYTDPTTEAVFSATEKLKKQEDMAYSDYDPTVDYVAQKNYEDTALRSTITKPNAGTPARFCGYACLASDINPNVGTPADSASAPYGTVTKTPYIFLFMIVSQLIPIILQDKTMKLLKIQLKPKTSYDLTKQVNDTFNSTKNAVKDTFNAPSSFTDSYYEMDNNTNDSTSENKLNILDGVKNAIKDTFNFPSNFTDSYYEMENNDTNTFTPEDERKYLFIYKKFLIIRVIHLLRIIFLMVVLFLVLEQVLVIVF